MGDSKFLTQRYITDAARTFGRLGNTTLRRTDNEGNIQQATARNLAVLGSKMRADEFAEFKEMATPHEVWGKVAELGLQDDPQAKRIITMSLGNPSAYTGYLPNVDVYDCLDAVRSTMMQKSSGYTASTGYPRLLRKMQRANFYDPESIHKDPELFGDVKVYLTTGSSAGVELAAAPMLLTPNDTVLVPDWTYIIHLAAGYVRNAHVDNWELRDDGRPDPEKFRKKLQGEKRRDRIIQAAVITTIGNPVGAAMSRDDLLKHLRIIEEIMEDEKRPILALVDVAYEAFRMDGKPLDPIQIAKEEGLRVPIAVLDTVSKGYGLCGWRMGKLAVLWPEDVYPETREDYFTCLENAILPKLGYVAVPLQMAFDLFLTDLAKDGDLMARTKEFFSSRRERINTNTLHIAQELMSIPGVYLSRYYDHAGANGGLDPASLSSFYVLFGFDGHATKEGSGFNQVKAFGKFALDTHGIPIIDCVPGQAFLPEKRVQMHQGLIRITSLTNEYETEAFLDAVRAYAMHLR